MKTATDILQSIKLAEILPIESADMRYAPFGDTHPWIWDGKFLEKGSIPAWSLSALMNALPKYPFREYNLVVTDGKPYVAFDDCNSSLHDDFFGEDFIDACYNMIITLHKMGVL